MWLKITDFRSFPLLRSTQHHILSSVLVNCKNNFPEKTFHGLQNAKDPNCRGRNSEIHPQNSPFIGMNLTVIFLEFNQR